MKINIKNLILVSIAIAIIIITGVVCIKTSQSKSTMIIKDTIASEISTASVSNKISTNGEFESENTKPNVVMSVTNTGDGYVTQVTNTLSGNKNTNNLVYGDGWVATKGYNPNEGKATNTANNNVKPIEPVENQNIHLERDMSKVKIEIVEGTLTNESVEILITDNNENSGGCGVHFFVQEKVNGEWRNLELLEGKDSWIEIFYITNEFNQIKDKLNIANHYGPLKPGIYRIGKNDYPGVFTEEFEIK